MEDKFILDACCGGRMFWFNKHHPNAIYIDNAPRTKGCVPSRPEFCCEPDIVMDFTKLEFPDKRFRLVVFDPPHLKSLTETSQLRQKFGVLNAQTWRFDLKKGFRECWRVLDDYGILIFKWNEEEIKSKDVLELFGVEPLFGHTTGSKSKTKWYCFIKLPKEDGHSSQG
jgi:hypothetical protein